MATKQKKFTAVIEKFDDGKDTAYVTIPFDVEKTYGSKGQIKIKAWFDTHPYRGVLANMGTGSHILGLRKDVRAAIKKTIGDSVDVILEKDEEERVVEIPDDLQKAFLKAKKAQAFYETLSYTNRKEYAVWITSAKKVETREKRLLETLKKLLN